jgi:hypothetical protein
MTRRGWKTALLCTGAVLAFGLAGCEDAEAVAKAEAAAKAKKVEAERLDKQKRKAAHNVDCISALRWQKAALSTARIGDLKLYEDYYRGRLEQAVGDAMIPSEGGPTLARSTMHDYLDWAYAENVRTKFTAGTDADKDGAVSPAEKNARGYNIVSACVLEVAEGGQGPLADKDKLQRMQHLQALRVKLESSGA